MKLYTAPRAPNPRRVRILLAEKGIALDEATVDLGRLDHKRDAYAAINPLRQVPVLELDDGTRIAESMAICRYFEELHPEPALFGRDARDRALVEMWQRRMELELFHRVTQAFRHTHPAMAEMEVPQVAEWGEANRPKVLETLAWLDSELAERRFVAGDRFTVADITALVAVDFMKPARIALPEGHAHLRRWHAEVSARPSAVP